MMASTAALNYAMLRILGVDAEDSMMVRARVTLHKLGNIKRQGTPSPN